MLTMVKFTLIGQISQLESPLNYNAEDSMVIDIINKKARLYGNAHIDYGTYNLDACYIEFDFDSKRVFARMCIDSNNISIGIPKLTDGSTETNADSLAFNFETKRGITYHVRMQEGEGYIHGNKVKRQENGEIHIDTALYTTCDLDHPHYYFKLRKAIIIPDDKIISGPINLFIADIPTPLGLPFAFLPNQEKRTNGIIIPSYGNSASQGFYLSGGGYYHKFKNNRFDTQLTGDIFTKGSWALNNQTNYKTRYQNNGSFGLTYRQTKLGEKEFNSFSKSTDFLIKWNHIQDPKSIPSMTFRASLEAGTSSVYENNAGTQILNSNDYLKNNFNSNISWSKTFKKLPSNLSVNARHNQNSSTKLVTITLPDITYSINRFYPSKWIKSNKAFKSSFRKQIDKIGLTYITNIKNETYALENEIGISDISNLRDNLKYGAKHKLNVGTSFSVLGGALNISPNITSQALNYFYKEQHSYDTNLDSVIINNVQEFNVPYWTNYSISASSKLYGFYEFATFLQGKRKSKIRHTLTPGANFTLNPNPGYRYQYKRDTITEYYSPYGNQIFGAPPQSESGIVSFSLNNAFELRQNTLAKDSLDDSFRYKKVLDNLSINSGYNLLADSLNWSNINISGRTNIANKLSTRFGLTLDPYDRDTLNRVYNVLLMDSENKLFNVTKAFLNFGFNLKSKKQQKQVDLEDSVQVSLKDINTNNNIAWEWDLNVGYNISYNKIFNFELGDSAKLIQTINLNGSMNLTSNLNFNFQTNYDISNKQFSFTSFNLMRDLHCWQIQFNWIPFGFQKSYNIQINVKASLLRDLKLQRRQIWQDNGVR
ncbi:MAG: hypothetical protein ACI8Q1_000825 [Parvicella sp.]|jgi:hypothetical protein